MVLGRPMNGIYVYQDEGIVQSEAEIPYYYKSDGAKRPLLLGVKIILYASVVARLKIKMVMGR